jgi:hypothetical protein
MLILVKFNKNKYFMKEEYKISWIIVHRVTLLAYDFSLSFKNLLSTVP